MTAHQRHPRKEPELDRYVEVISRARGALPALTTASLFRIRELLERALEGAEPDAAAIDELARMLAGDA